ncbi:MAG: type II toxin-antitoxin system VapC family toxin [Candidatus Acidiferrum sp.]
MIAYADTGFLVSLYGQDAHSIAARGMAQGQPAFLLTPLGEAEFVNALELQVFRKQWTRSQAQTIHNHFLQHQAAAIIRSEPFPVEAWERAVILSRRHGATLGVRTLDVLHVASALVLKPDVFLTFDTRQSKLARTEGLRVLPG